jgi:monoamine oxidase
MLKADTWHLSSSVSQISQPDNEPCLVETKNGMRFYCKKVVISLPTCLYPTIEFQPPLPPAKQTLAANTALGYYSKTIFVFDSPWWHDVGLLGVFLSVVGAAVPEVTIPEPVEIFEKEWTKDPWAQGAPSPVMMPGTMTGDAGKAIREQFGSIHFVGTETALIWKGYLEGAVRSGIRGAGEVIQALKE